MIKSFKKTKKSVNDIRLAAMPTNKVIEEIHNTFYTEVNRILESAKIETVVDESIVEKHSRLSNLGFTSTVYADLSAKERKKENSNTEKRKTIDAVRYFSQKYPLYKFITKESIDRICDKYNLVYADVNYYIGDVPEKNIQEIENFKVEDEDAIWLMKDREDYFMRWRDPIRTNFQQHNMETSDRVLYTSNGRAPFMICAPITDFDTSKLELEGRRLRVHIPDPIVLQPVSYKGREYYLIVTAWGDEASDPEVVNNINN